jgi:hypothetical protein
VLAWVHENVLEVNARVFVVWGADAVVEEDLSCAMIHILERTLPL